MVREHSCCASFQLNVNMGIFRPEEGGGYYMIVLNKRNPRTQFKYDLKYCPSCGAKVS